MVGLLLGATVASVAVLIEVTESSGGTPARALPVVGPLSAVPSALPSALPLPVGGPAGTPPAAAGPVSVSASATTSVTARGGSSAGTASASASVRPGAGGAGGAGGASPVGRRTAAPAVLSAGDSGPDVSALQRLLFDQGFTYVAATGVYDAATVRGVTQLQQNRSITGDPAGVYGPRTRASLQGGS